MHGGSGIGWNVGDSVNDGCGDAMGWFGDGETRGTDLQKQLVLSVGESSRSVGAGDNVELLHGFTGLLGFDMV